MRIGRKGQSVEKVISEVNEAMIKIRALLERASESERGVQKPDRMNEWTDYLELLFPASTFPLFLASPMLTSSNDGQFWGCKSTLRSVEYIADLPGFLAFLDVPPPFLLPFLSSSFATFSVNPLQITLIFLMLLLFLFGFSLLLAIPFPGIASPIPPSVDHRLHHFPALLDEALLNSAEQMDSLEVTTVDANKENEEEEDEGGTGEEEEETKTEQAEEEFIRGLGLEGNETETKLVEGPMKRSEEEWKMMNKMGTKEEGEEEKEGEAKIGRDGQNSTNDTEEERCHPKLDLLFLRDTTGEGGSLQQLFQEHVRWAVSLVESLPLEQDAVRVTAAQFAGFPLSEFALGTYPSTEDIQKHRQSAQFQQSEDIRTGYALRKAEAELFRGGARIDAGKLIVLFTDGLSIEDQSKAAEQLRELKHVKIFVVSEGGGGAAKNPARELKNQIASLQKDNLFGNGPDELARLRAALLTEAERAQACIRIGDQIPFNGPIGGRPLSKIIDDPVVEALMNNGDNGNVYEGGKGGGGGGGGGANTVMEEEEEESPKEDEVKMRKMKESGGGGNGGRKTTEGDEDGRGRVETSTAPEEEADEADDGSGKNRTEGMIIEEGKVISSDRAPAHNREASPPNGVEMTPEELILSMALNSVTLEEGRGEPEAEEGTLADNGTLEEEGKRDEEDEENNSPSSSEREANAGREGDENGTLDPTTTAKVLILDKAKGRTVPPAAGQRRREWEAREEIAEFQLDNNMANQSMSNGELLNSSSISSSSLNQQQSVEGDSPPVFQYHSISSNTTSTPSLPFSKESSTEQLQLVDVVQQQPDRGTDQKQELELEQNAEETEEEKIEEKGKQDELIKSKTDEDDRQKGNDQTEKEEEADQKTTTTRGDHDQQRAAPETAEAIGWRLFCLQNARATMAWHPSCRRVQLWSQKNGGDAHSLPPPAISHFLPGTPTGHPKDPIPQSITGDDHFPAELDKSNSDRKLDGEAMKEDEAEDEEEEGEEDREDKAEEEGTTQRTQKEEEEEEEVLISDELRRSENAKSEGSDRNNDQNGTDHPMGSDHHPSLLDAEAAASPLSSSTVPPPIASSSVQPFSAERDDVFEEFRSDAEPTEYRHHPTFSANVEPSNTSIATSPPNSSTTTILGNEEVVIGNSSTIENLEEIGEDSEWKHKVEDPTTKSKHRNSEQIEEETDEQKGQNQTEGETPKTLEGTTKAPIGRRAFGAVLAQRSKVPPLSIGCPSLDLLFILDSSGSVHKVYDAQKQWLQDILSQIQQLADPQKGARVALIQFAGAEVQKTEWAWDRFNRGDNGRMMDAFHQIRHLSGTTYIGRALQLAQHLLQNRQRQVPAFVVLLSDGFSQDDAVQDARQLRLLPNTQFVALSISDLSNTDYLQRVTDNPSHVFIGPMGADLLRAQLLRRIRCGA